MQSHNDAGSGREPEDHKPEEVNTSLGYEGSDVNVAGLVVFLAAMAIFVVVTALVC